MICSGETDSECYLTLTFPSQNPPKPKQYILIPSCMINLVLTKGFFPLTVTLFQVAQMNVKFLYNPK